jgi:hypothetical protein
MAEHIPSEEEFAAWRDHPVTQFVMLAHRKLMAQCRQDWIDRSWHVPDSISPDEFQLERDRLWLESNAYSFVVNATWSRYAEIVGP